MEPYLFESQFHNDLLSWMTARFLSPILYIEGGWEYWIQIDFPVWLQSSNDKPYDFRREVTGVIPKTRLDWLINSQSTGYHPIAVQIKAQTHKYQTTNFISDLQKEIRDLNQLGGNRNKVMLAAVIDPSAQDQLIKMNFQRILNYSNLTAFYMYYW